MILLILHLILINPMTPFIMTGLIRLIPLFHMLFMNFVRMLSPYTLPILLPIAYPIKKTYYQLSLHVAMLFHTRAMATLITNAPHNMFIVNLATAITSCIIFTGAIISTLHALINFISWCDKLIDRMIDYCDKYVFASLEAIGRRVSKPIHSVCDGIVTRADRYMTDNDWILLVESRHKQNEIKYSKALDTKIGNCITMMTKETILRRLIGTDAINKMINRSNDPSNDGDTSSIMEAFAIYKQESMSRIRQNLYDHFYPLQKIDVRRETMNIYSYIVSYVNSRADFGDKYRVVYNGNERGGEFMVFKYDVIRQTDEYQFIKLVRMIGTEESDEANYIFAEFCDTDALHTLEEQIYDRRMDIHLDRIETLLGTAFNARAIDDLDIDHPLPYGEAMIYYDNQANQNDSDDDSSDDDSSDDDDSSWDTWSE